jgi:hypothetical protein
LSESVVETFFGLVILLFVVAMFTVAKPKSGSGTLARKLCIANAIGWLILLPLSSSGSPPQFLIPGLLFWLINTVLMPASVVALVVSLKERTERTGYLLVTSTYVAINIVVLFIVPLAWVVIGSER